MSGKVTDVISAEPGGPSPLVLQIDIVKLEGELADLVNAYKSALRIVSRLPRFGRWKTTVVTRRKDPSGSQMNEHERRRVARAFVKLFVESHIRARIGPIIDALSIEAISLDYRERRDQKAM